MNRLTYWLTSQDKEAVQWRTENPKDVEKYDRERREELAAIFGLNPEYFPNWKQQMTIDQDFTKKKAIGPRVFSFKEDEPDE